MSQSLINACSLINITWNSEYICFQLDIICATNFITNHIKYLIYAHLGEYFNFNMIIYKYLIIIIDTDLHPYL